MPEPTTNDSHAPTAHVSPPLTEGSTNPVPPGERAVPPTPPPHVDTRELGATEQRLAESDDRDQLREQVTHEGRSLPVLGTDESRVASSEDVIVDGVIIGSAPDSAGRADILRNYRRPDRGRDPGMTPSGVARGGR